MFLWTTRRQQASRPLIHFPTNQNDADLHTLVLEEKEADPWSRNCPKTGSIPTGTFPKPELLRISWLREQEGFTGIWYIKQSVMGSGHETQATREHPPLLGLWTPSHPSKAQRPQFVVFCFSVFLINTHSRVVSLRFFSHFRHSHGRSSTHPPNSPGRSSMSIKELQPSERGSRDFKNQWKAPSALPAALLPAVAVFLKKATKTQSVSIPSPPECCFSLQDFYFFHKYFFKYLWYYIIHRTSCN